MARSSFVSVVAALAFAAPAPAQFNSGDLYVASWKSQIWRVDPTTWKVTLFVDSSAGLNGVSALCYTSSDQLVCSNYYSSQVIGFDSAGSGTVLYDSTSGLSGPFGENGIATTLGGDLFVSNFDSKEILRCPVGGTPYDFADSSVGVVHPDGLAFDARNDLLVANRDGGNVLAIDKSGSTTVFDTLPGQPYSIAQRQNGDLYVALLYGDIYRYAGGVASARTLFLSFGQKLGTPTMRFNLDGSVLYFTSYGKGNLLTIDPDTAKYTEVLPAGSIATPLSIEVAGQRKDVGLPTYGVGTAGAGGLVPTLAATGHPVFGQPLTVEIRDFVGGATGLIVAGAGKTTQHGLGGTIYVDLAQTFAFFPLALPGAPGNPGDGDLDLPATTPSDPLLDGYTAYFQVWAADPAAKRGVAMTNGLAITFRAW